MAKTDFKSIDEYLATLPRESQEILEQVRKAIKKAVPEAEEVISYQIPAFKFHGWIFYISAHAKHYSLSCPPPLTVFEEFREELSPYEISKSAVKFPLDQPVPAALIGKMAVFRAKQNLDLEKTKAKKG